MDTARRKVAAFTLVELLIAISIATMLIAISTYAFSLFSRDWSGRQSGFDRESSELQRVELMNDAISGAIPWVVRDERGGVGFYFLGRVDGFTLVTANGVFSQGTPAVVRIFSEPDGVGQKRLVYEEATLDTTLLDRADQVLPFKHRMIVLSGLRKLGFSYFGWESRARRTEALDGGSHLPVWFEAFDGLIRRDQPLKLTIAIDDNAVQYALPERAGYGPE